MRRAVLIALLALTGALYLVMVLWSLPYVAGQAGGLPPFDLRPLGYSPDEAQAFLTALSAEGRAFYAGTQHALDAIFPPALAATMAWAAVLLWRGWVRWVLIALALVACWADLAENHAVAGLLQGFETGLAETASRWSVLKSGASTIAYSLLLIGLARRLWHKVRR